MGVKFVSSLVPSRVYSWTRKVLKKRLAKNGILISRCGSHAREGLELIYKIREEVSMLQSDYESYQLYIMAKGLEKVNGDIAEVGVAAGATAKILCEVKGDKSLHLFDTFEGLPKPDYSDAPCFYEGQFSSSLESVKQILKDHRDVYYHEGLFPATAEGIKDTNFSFVHLDVDIYSSTLNCLKWFYPRMSRGGIILSHDYHRSRGVKRAFMEFFLDKCEPVLQLIGDQCFVTKL